MWCIGILVMRCVLDHAQPATAGATFCTEAKPIYWNAADTRKTKEQADLHNATGKALCGWGKKK